MAHALEGQVVVVTGASSGIGKATARALSRCGAKVVLAARSLDRLEQLARELGPGALAVQTDVTRGDDVARLVTRALERFSRIDVLFANAGLYVPGEVAEGDPEAWARLIDVNVNGVLRAVRAVLPHMIARGAGDVLVTSSISGHVDIHWEPVYSASKHAIQAFVHCLRRQVARHGIRVGAVAPGMVLNELWEAIQGPLTPAVVEERVAARSGLRSEDVADAVLYMLSAPRHVTIRDLVLLPQRQDL